MLRICDIFSYKSICTLLIAALIVTLSRVVVHAQSAGIEAGFLKNHTECDAGEVAGNVLRVKNNTGRDVRFTLVYSHPENWQLLGSAQKQVSLDAGDSAFIPVRIIPEKLAKGGTGYIVSVSLISDKRVQFASVHWYVNLAEKSRWTAKLPQKNHYFIHGSDSSAFTVVLKNQGNTDESIRVSLLPDRNLHIINPDGSPAPLNHSVTMLPGTDTTLHFTVRRTERKSIHQLRRDGEETNSHHESFNLQILARNENRPSSWSGTAQFIRAGFRGQKNEFGRSALPLTVEANAYDVLSAGTTMSLDAYGNSTLAQNTFLNYRFQTVFVTNFLNENAFLGNNHYIGYFSNKGSLEIGEVNGWGRSLLAGRGIKGAYNIRNHQVGAMYTRAPGFFNDYSSEGYGFFHNYRKGGIQLSSSYSHYEHLVSSLKNDIASTFAGWKINRHHQLNLRVGASRENYLFQNDRFLFPGYGYDLNYGATYKRLNFTAGHSYGSENYSLARGIRLYTSRTGYRLNERHNLTLSTQNFTQRAGMVHNGVSLQNNKIRSDRYELRWGIQSARAGIAVKPMFQVQENLNLRVHTRGSGFEYHARNISSVRLSSTLFAGYADAIDYDLEPFFIARAGISARWEKLYLSLRYYYGPNQLAEQLRFINNMLNPQAVHLNSNYDLWFGKDRFLLSTSSNFSYETLFERINFRMRPELFYYTKDGFRLSAYASFQSQSQQANPLLTDFAERGPYEGHSSAEMNIGFGVRKQIGIPIPGKKFVTIRVVTFKDINGNRRQDQNEEGSMNILVNIRPEQIFGADSMDVREYGEDFLTNEKGEVIYENIPPGIYSISITPLVSQGDWFEPGIEKILIDKKQMILIPLSKGISLNGSILVEKDKYSGQDEYDLSRIRITAIDSSGKSYSSLTTKDGRFSLYLPAGYYTVTLNEAALDDRLIAIQNKMLLDLSQKMDNYQITFNVTERKRKMNIRKFGEGK